MQTTRWSILGRTTPRHLPIPFPSPRQLRGQPVRISQPLATQQRVPQHKSAKPGSTRQYPTLRSMCSTDLSTSSGHCFKNCIRDQWNRKTVLWLVRVAHANGAHEVDAIMPGAASQKTIHAHAADRGVCSANHFGDPETQTVANPKMATPKMPTPKIRFQQYFFVKSLARQCRFLGSGRRMVRNQFPESPCGCQCGVNNCGMDNLTMDLVQARFFKMGRFFRSFGSLEPHSSPPRTDGSKPQARLTRHPPIPLPWENANWENADAAT